MPTLEEILGKSPAITPGESLEDYFNTDNVAMDPIPYSALDEQPGIYEERESRNAVLDFVGQGLWSFLDTAAFSVPSLLAPKELEESYLQPETAAGRAASAIGGTAGFITGAPLKVGAKAVRMLAKPFIKKMGKQTVDDIVKKTAAEVTKTAGKEGFTLTKEASTLMNKEVGKRLTYLSHKSRWDRAGKGAAENWGKAASKAIDDVVNGSVQLGELTAKEAQLIASTFKKNIGTRPMQDFIDIMMSRYPNKWGWLAGNIIQEGTVFGMIDAAMEVSHSLNEDRPYDFMAYAWGAGIGSAFGALRLLPAAGKQSITSEDFKSGLKSVMFKNHFRKMDKEKLINNAHIIGKTKISKIKV